MTSTKMRQSTLPILVCAAVVVGVVCSVPPRASADIRYGRGTHAYPVWVTAAAFKDKIEHPLDPFEFFFLDRTYVGNQAPVDNSGNVVTDGHCGRPADYYRCRVQLAYEYNWDGSAIPSQYKAGRRWYNHGTTFPIVGGGKDYGPHASPLGEDAFCANDTQNALFDSNPRSPSFNYLVGEDGGTGGACQAR